MLQDLACGGNALVFDSPADCPVQSGMDIENASLAFWILHRRNFLGSSGWSVWGNWNPCSATCGSGSQTRKRFCISPQVLVSPVFDKLRTNPSRLLFLQGSCSGNDQENKSCKSDVPCETWRGWSSWGECSASCGKGIQLRTRLCPSGVSCDGNFVKLHKLRD